MTTKQKVIATVVVFISGAAVGRFSLPARIETKTVEKIVEKIVQTTQKDKQSDKVVVVIEETRPDGTKVKRTEIVDKSTTVTETQIDKNKTQDRTDQKTVEYAKNEWFIRAMAAGRIGEIGWKYGLGVDKRILGPFYLGAFGMTDKTLGVTLGVSF